MSARYRILLVEPEPLLREMLAEAVRLHRADVRVDAAVDMVAATDKIGCQPYDLLILGCDPAADPARLNDLIAPVDEVVPGSPILVLGGMPGGCRCRGRALPRNPSMEEVLGAVSSLLAERADSILRGMSLPSVLQMLEHDRSSCVLAIEAGRDCGYLFVREGRLAAAMLGELRGKPAALALLSRADGAVRVMAGCRVWGTQGESLTALLLEWSLQRDENNCEGPSWTRSN